jgi:hypothetical protein
VRRSSDQRRGKSIAKTQERVSDIVNKRLQQWEKEPGLAPFGLQGYLDVNTAVVTGLRWRHALEGPGLNVLMGFHRAPGTQILVKPVFRRKLAEFHGLFRGRYHMELPVFVDVVEGIEKSEGLPNVKPAIIPSYVWLQVLDRPLITPSQLLHPPGPLIKKIGLRTEDREQRPPLSLLGDSTSEVANMQFVSEVVQCAPKIEDDFPSPQSPVRIDGPQLAQIEAVLKSSPIYFGPNGPCLRWRPYGSDLLLEFYSLEIGARELGDWPFKAPAHPISLAGDAKQQRQRADT